jgi:hypothetical protein
MVIETGQGEGSHRGDMFQRVAPRLARLEPTDVGLEDVRISLEREDAGGVNIDPSETACLTVERRAAATGSPPGGWAGSPRPRTSEPLGGEVLIVKGRWRTLRTRNRRPHWCVRRGEKQIGCGADVVHHAAHRAPARAPARLRQGRSRAV